MEIGLCQQTEDWLKFRQNKIGASDAPVIMGVSPWKTPYELWQEKTGLKVSEFNFAMQYGIANEERARHEYNRIKGETYCPCVFVSDELPWMMASIDGMNFDRARGVEIKCCGKESHDIAKLGMVPQHYYPQLQHQMFVCGLEEIDYFSFHGSEGIIICVSRDNDYIYEMVKKEEEFYDCLINFKEPALTDRDYITHNEDEWTETAEQWKSVHFHLEDLKIKEQELRNKLEILSNGKNAIVSGVKISHCLRLGAIDYASIPELSQVNLDEYRKKPSSYVRINPQFPTKPQKKEENIT